MESKLINISDLVMNMGQIEGVPSNPRSWTESDVRTMAKSLRETPELFAMRPIIVAEHNGQYIVLGGNLRLQGAKRNKNKQVPCIVVPADMTADKMREVVIKDNGSFGSWDHDALANEWDDLPLTDWGVPAWETEKDEKDAKEGEPSSYKVEIECLNEVEQGQVYQRMTEEGFTCKMK